jgi:class 3 adenylate cyclase
MVIPEPSHAPPLEIAHVLYMDIVAYSTLPMDQQRQVLQVLQEAVRNTSEFVRAHSEDRLLRLPTGDGMALVFSRDPEAPARCALELSRSLQDRPGIKVRMGIHSGPVYRIADINANRNVSGGGINVAQRVMDCGDAGHILTSSAEADVLGQISAWRPMLHDLGEVRVKHGCRLHLYNLYTTEAGNPENPKRISASTRWWRHIGSRGVTFGFAVLAIILYLILTLPRTTTELPITSTHTTAGIGTDGLSDQFRAGRCTAGVPDISGKIQWTWVLRGARFACVSNISDSRAIIDFDAGVFAIADTHTTIPIGIKGETVEATVIWYSPRGDGSVKWVISTACVPSGEINFTMRDALTIIDSPGSDLTHEHVSAGNFALSDCKPLDILAVGLSRHGDEKEDTLRAVAHVTELSIRTHGPLTQIPVPNAVQDLEPKMEHANGLMQKLAQEIPQGYRYDPERGVFVRVQK